MQQLTLTFRKFFHSISKSNLQEPGRELHPDKNPHPCGCRQMVDGWPASDQFLSPPTLVSWTSVR